MDVAIKFNKLMSQHMDTSQYFRFVTLAKCLFPWQSANIGAQGPMFGHSVGSLDCLVNKRRVVTVRF